MRRFDRNHQLHGYLLGLLLASRCTTPEPPLFERLDAGTTGVTFANTLSLTDSLNALTFQYAYNGGGVAVGDVTNDGLPDLFFCGNTTSSRLYVNKGNLTFEDVTARAGVATSRWATGAAMVDINQDGFLDIYVCVAGKVSPEKRANLLFVNNGNGTFTERAREYGIADTGYSTQAAFFDYDRDGDLDMYLLTNGMETFNHNVTRPIKTNGDGISTDRLYRNDGPPRPTPALPNREGNSNSPSPSGKAAHQAANKLGGGAFTDVSKEAGITIEGYGLGIAVSDINQDGWPDVYCANDFISNDLLWINNRNGTFTNQAARYFKHTSYNGMGADVADFNNDGLPDVVELDMLPEDNKRQKTMFSTIGHDKFELNRKTGYQPQYVRNTLQLNNGNGTFSEIGQLAGVHATDWSWSALFADFDQDGWKDLFVTNGYRKDITDMDFVKYSRDVMQFGSEKTVRKRVNAQLEKLPGAPVHNYIFRNAGDLTFDNQSEAWGFTEPSYANGAAYADLDNDGDLDLVVNNLDEPAAIYRNHARERHNTRFLKIRLAGDSLNRNGVGAKITVHHNDRQQFFEQMPYRGYKSSVELAICIGLGSDSLITQLEVTWPDGKYQQLQNIRANQTLTLNYRNASARPPERAAPVEPLFREVTAAKAIAYQHRESDFMDFKIQPTLPHRFSRNGPGLATGDVNGDGLADFFVGGASGQSGKVFHQQPDGKFTSRLLEDEQKRQEDVAATFFDADNDNDLDLYVVSGSSEFGATSAMYQDRLYLNDGDGKFTPNPDALPAMPTSGSCVAAADFDRDGDQDLFVGGSAIPGKYPLPARSYLLRNDGGRFMDVTSRVEGLGEIGLVTDAIWTDTNNDRQPDLMIVGEWMPITVFQNKSGKLIQNHLINHSLTHSNGWWNRLAAGDFDQDGDTDYVAGNVGLNSRYKASVAEPVCVYAKDYDQNGSIDPVLCHYVQGKNYVAHPRDVLIDQIVAMRRRFPTYASYANATVEQTFTKEELTDAYVGRAENFASGYVENRGNGTFALHPLPVEAQFSAIYGIVCRDFTGDGKLDVLLSGNSYATETQTGWYDASIGLLLRGDGRGNFAPVPATRSGFLVGGDVKNMDWLTGVNDQSLVVVACNNDSLRVFSAPARTSPTALLRTYPK